MHAVIAVSGCTQVQQAAGRDCQLGPDLGVRRIVIFAVGAGIQGDEGVVGVVAAVHKDADQRFVAGRIGERIHRAERTKTGGVAGSGQRCITDEAAAIEAHTIPLSSVLMGRKTALSTTAAEGHLLFALPCFATG